MVGSHNKKGQEWGELRTDWVQSISQVFFFQGPILSFCLIFCPRFLFHPEMTSFLDFWFVPKAEVSDSVSSLHAALGREPSFGSFFKGKGHFFLAQLTFESSWSSYATFPPLNHNPDNPNQVKLT